MIRFRYGALEWPNVLYWKEGIVAGIWKLKLDNIS
jgi:hypothetical protein